MSALRIALAISDVCARARLRRLLAMRDDVRVSEYADMDALTHAWRTAPADLVLCDPCDARASRQLRNLLSVPVLHAIASTARAADPNNGSPGLKPRTAVTHAGRDGCERRIAVPVGRRVHLVDVASIDSARAQRNYVELQTGGSAVVLRASLEDVLSRLPADEFVRVHRSAVVRIAAVARLESLGSSRWRIVLASGRTLVGSRRCAADLIGRLGLARDAMPTQASPSPGHASPR
jgi:two-component system LytT family response regulator